MRGRKTRIDQKLDELILIFGSDTFLFKYIFEHHPWVKKEAHTVTIVLPECAEISRSAVNI